MHICNAFFCTNIGKQSILRKHRLLPGVALVCSCFTYFHRLICSYVLQGLLFSIRSFNHYRIQHGNIVQTKMQRQLYSKQITSIGRLFVHLLVAVVMKFYPGT